MKLLIACPTYNLYENYTYKTITKYTPTNEKLFKNSMKILAITVASQSFQSKPFHLSTGIGFIS
jgi:hypothetical protein